jgi:hypothetical protein
MTEPPEPTSTSRTRRSAPGSLKHLQRRGPTAVAPGSRRSSSRGAGEAREAPRDRPDARRPIDDGRGAAASVPSRTTSSISRSILVRGPAAPATCAAVSASRDASTPNVPVPEAYPSPVRSRARRGRSHHRRDWNRGQSWRPVAPTQCGGYRLHPGRRRGHSGRAPQPSRRAHPSRRGDRCAAVGVDRHRAGNDLAMESSRHDFTVPPAPPRWFMRRSGLYARGEIRVTTGPTFQGAKLELHTPTPWSGSRERRSLSSWSRPEPASACWKAVMVGARAMPLVLRAQVAAL